MFNKVYKYWIMKKMMKKNYIVYIIIGIIVIVAGYLFYNSQKQINYDSFAKCLSSKNVTMYGTYWCSHCAEQKKIFGDSFQYVTYVECGVPGDYRGQTEICKRENIEYYPTWVINGGQYQFRVEQSIEKLSSLSGCLV